MSWPGRAYRVLLIAYPARFRRAFGPELVAAFEQGLADRDGSGDDNLLRYWTWALRDLATTAARARWEQIAGLVRRRRHQPVSVTSWPVLHAPPSRWEGFMDKLRGDLRYGVRVLIRSPGFSAVVLLTLALGIGANTAIFSIVNGVVLRRLPYPDSERLVAVRWQWQREAGGTGVGFSAYKFEFWRENGSVFDGFAAGYFGNDLDISGEDTPESVTGALVDHRFFDVLGAGPALGREFTAEEDVVGGPRVAVISDSLWKRRYGARSGVLGQRIIVNGEPHEIVGVLSPEFSFRERPELFLPLRLAADVRDPAHNYPAIARLRPGVSVEQARADMQLVLERFAAEVPGGGVDLEVNGIYVAPLREAWVGEVSGSLWILLGAVGVVLLIACANVANLLLSRAASRNREIAIRAALGASRGRVLWQLLVESLVLAVAGGAVGLLAASWSLGSLSAFVPAGTPRVDEIDIDANVLLFSLAVSMLTGLLFGLSSAIGASNPDLHEALKQGGRGSGAAARPRVRNALVVVEVALSIVLLVGAAVLIASFFQVRGVDPGFDPEGLLTMEVKLAPAKYPMAQDVAAFSGAVSERIRALPGVESVATVSSVPLERGLNTMAGVDTPEGIERIYIEYRAISPGYFRTMGIAVGPGREFTDADSTGGRPVAIVSREFASRAWPDQSPLGQTVIPSHDMGDLEGPPREVVGVVDDIKEIGLASSSPPAVFVPETQVPLITSRVMNDYFPTAVIIRTDAVAGVAPRLRQIVADIDPSQAVRSIRTVDEVIGDGTREQRFRGLLMGAFAAVALLLAVIGLYGLISFSVSQRTREIGLRIALGAEQNRVLRLIFLQGIRLVAIGVVVGLLGAVAMAGLLESLVFEISPLDARAYLGVAVLLMLVAAAAIAIPASRATRVDPLTALRAE